MNRTNWQHLGYSIVIQVLAAIISLPLLYHLQAPLVLSLWIGAAASVGAFIMREYTQRGLHIAITQMRRQEDLGLLEPFTGWTLDAKLDALFPILGTLAVAAGATRYFL